MSDLAVERLGVSPARGYVGQPLTYTIDVTNNGPARRARCRPERRPALRPGRGFDHLDPGRGPAGEPGDPHGRPRAAAGRADRGRDAGRHPRQLGRGHAHDRRSRSRVRTTTRTPRTISDRRGGRRAVVRPGRGHRAGQCRPRWPRSTGRTPCRSRITGPSPATGVVATIPLPAGVQFVSASSSQGVAPAEQGGVLTADLGTIASGGSATVTVVIDPTSAVAGGTIPLAATVAGDQYDPNPGEQPGLAEPGGRPVGQPRHGPDLHAAGRPERPDRHVHRLGQQPGPDAGDGRPRDVPAGERPGLRPPRRPARGRRPWSPASSSPAWATLAPGATATVTVTRSGDDAGDFHADGVRLGDRVQPRPAGGLGQRLGAGRGIAR